MRIDTKILFTFSVLHSYYNEGICKCLRFMPGPVTTALQSRYGFLQRNFTNGFEFYADYRDNPTDLLNYIQSITGHSFFDFSIEVTNTVFYQVTKFPGNQASRFYYDTSTAVSERTDSKILLKEKTVEKIITPVAGLVRFYFKDLIIHIERSSKPDYCVMFNANATQWQYYIISKDPLAIGNPYIKGNNNIEFEGPEMMTIPTGQEAFCFSSGSTLLPLEEKATYTFSLLNRPATVAGGYEKSTKGKMVVKSLPSPDPSRFDTVLVNGEKQVSSPIYVFI
jgi:hypothetical protein